MLKKSDTSPALQSNFFSSNITSFFQPSFIFSFCYPWMPIKIIVTLKEKYWPSEKNYGCSIRRQSSFLFKFFLTILFSLFIFKQIQLCLPKSTKKEKKFKDEMAKLWIFQALYTFFTFLSFLNLNPNEKWFFVNSGKVIIKNIFKAIFVVVVRWWRFRCRTVKMSFHDLTKTTPVHICSTFQL